MSVLPAQTIRKLCLDPTSVPGTPVHLSNALIVPFSERGKHNGMTYGLGPCTYDLRIKQRVILMPWWQLPLWLLYRAVGWLRAGYNEDAALSGAGGSVTRNTNKAAHYHCGFALASTIERVCFPNDVCGTVLDKSSWARQGLAVQNTKFDPGFEGHPTLELTNHGLRTLDIKAGAPICQFKFERLEEPTEMPYVGRYQKQGDEPTPYRPAKGMWE